MDILKVNTDNIFTDQSDTDVSDLKSDATVRIGIEQFPVFDVDHDTFYNINYTDRIKFTPPENSKIEKYLKNTQTRRPIYVRHIDKDGNVYVKGMK